MSNGRTKGRVRERPGHLRGNGIEEEESHQQEKKKRKKREREREREIREEEEVQSRLRRTGEAGHVWGVESGDARCFWRQELLLWTKMSVNYDEEKKINRIQAWNRRRRREQTTLFNTVHGCSLSIESQLVPFARQTSIDD